MNKYQAFEIVNDALRYVWAIMPPKQFPSDFPDLCAAVQTLETARYSLMVELEPWKYRPRA